jgi:hypothetical protein
MKSDKVLEFLDELKAEFQKIYGFSYKTEHGLYSEKKKRYYDSRDFSNIKDLDIIMFIDGKVKDGARKRKSSKEKETSESGSQKQSSKELDLSLAEKHLNQYLPYLFQEFEKSLPGQPFVSGLSRVNGKIYLSGTNGVFECRVKSKELIKTDDSVSFTNDPFAVEEDRAFSNPSDVFEDIHEIVKKFEFEYEHDSYLFTLYIMYLGLQNPELSTPLNLIITGRPNSGKTNLTAFIAEDHESGDPNYRGFSLIPWSLRVTADSDISAVQNEIGTYHYNSVVFDNTDSKHFEEMMRILQDNTGEKRLVRKNGAAQFFRKSVIIAGSDLDLSGNVSSRHITFNLYVPSPDTNEVLSECRKLGENRNALITQLHTNLLPYENEIMENLDELRSGNMTQNIYNVLLAIGKVVLEDEEYEQIVAEVKEKVKWALDTTNESQSAKEHIDEILKIIMKEKKHKSMESLAEEIAGKKNGGWRKHDKYSLWARKENDGYQLAIKFPLLSEIKESKLSAEAAKWVSSFRNDRHFNRNGEEQEIGHKDSISYRIDSESHSARVLILDSEKFMSVKAEELVAV